MWLERIITPSAIQIAIQAAIGAKVDLQEKTSKRHAKMLLQNVMVAISTLVNCLKKQKGKKADGGRSAMWKYRRGSVFGGVGKDD